MNRSLVRVRWYSGLGMVIQFFCQTMCQEIILPYGDFKSMISFIKSYLPENPVIIEAGAYCGRNSIMMSVFWPSSTIYSFEPVPQIYTRLLKNTSRFNNIHCYQLALSDTDGVATFHISQDPTMPWFPSQSNSLLPPKDHLLYSPLTFKKEIMVSTITLDSWALRERVERIDFIWLNMQGYALHALMASPHVLKKAHVIALEVEFVEVYKGQKLFVEVKQWMQNQGFEVVAVNFDGIKKYWFGDVVFVKKN